MLDDTTVPPSAIRGSQVFPAVETLNFAGCDIKDEHLGCLHVAQQGQLPEADKP